MYKDINPFGLRLPAELKAKMEEAAQANHRSLNAELVAVIQESLGKRTGLEQFTDGEMIDELIKRWGRDAVLIQLGKK